MNRTILLLTITLLAVACGSSAEPPDTNIAQTSQGATTYHSVQNGITSLPTSSTKFCRLTSTGSRNGHELSGYWSIWTPDWPNWVAKNGSVVIGEPPSLIAKTYGSQPTSSRYASASAACNSYSDFGFGPAAQQSSNIYMLWNTSSGEQYVTWDQGLWSTSDSFCYVNGFDSMSHPDEVIETYPYPAGGLWYMQGLGYPKLAGFIKCIKPNRTFQRLGPYTVTGAGAWQNVQGPPTSPPTICAFTRFQGNMDDVTAYIYEEGGYWKMLLQLHDLNEPWTHSVEMTCVRFP